MVDWARILGHSIYAGFLGGLGAVVALVSTGNIILFSAETGIAASSAFIIGFLISFYADMKNQENPVGTGNPHPKGKKGIARYVFLW